jgi:uncharacterized membrane protein YukC
VGLVRCKNQTEVKLIARPSRPLTVAVNQNIGMLITSLQTHEIQQQNVRMTQNERSSQQINYKTKYNIFKYSGMALSIPTEYYLGERLLFIMIDLEIISLHCAKHDVLANTYEYSSKALLTSYRCIPIHRTEKTK